MSYSGVTDHCAMLSVYIFRIFCECFLANLHHFVMTVNQSHGVFGAVLFVYSGLNQVLFGFNGTENTDLEESRTGEEKVNNKYEWGQVQDSRSSR